ncbi:tudor domain-containing protein 7B-like isoform X2 [Oryzias melastigma]|nr:tudor domain-containing protein 7B-like isoform X2 [Oryzias melastigma]XP_036067150.1 tudor domain-containing protein 7B-like isoform X2 [Oryzias melastigma]XP_036067151.1 tudor domain-containing protein 7B-like isoform X2 [Oryzias melastigma]
MADVELVKKMLQGILHSNKGGVSLTRLQTEYKEATGEQIPHKQMGHNHLDTLLVSMPSVVRVERSRSGEASYFASAASERTHIAKVMAREPNSRRISRPHLVNTQMRVKPAAPFILNGRSSFVSVEIFVGRWMTSQENPQKWWMLMLIWCVVKNV